MKNKEELESKEIYKIALCGYFGGFGVCSIANSVLLTLGLFNVLDGINWMIISIMCLILMRIVLIK